MEKLSFYTVILINLIILVHYCIQTIRKKINPSLAMWVFFTIAVAGKDQRIAADPSQNQAGSHAGRREKECNGIIKSQQARKAHCGQNESCKIRKVVAEISNDPWYQRAKHQDRNPRYRDKNPNDAAVHRFACQYL